MGQFRTQLDSCPDLENQNFNPRNVRNNKIRKGSQFFHAIDTIWSLKDKLIAHFTLKVLIFTFLSSWAQVSEV